MKKITLGIALLSICTISQAGTMGPVATQSYVPYITAEAAYTSINIGNYITNGITEGLTRQGWGGRLGAGIAYPSYFDGLSLTAEIGGGYYGSAKHTGPTLLGALSSSHKLNIDGFDVLVGTLYKTTYVDIFGQAGFMIQNARHNNFENEALTVPGGLLSGTVTDRYNVTQALPEVKVGAIYNWNENWGLTVAYMGVFGSQLSTINSIINELNPTLNSVMFGLRYSIV